MIVYAYGFVWLDQSNDSKVLSNNINIFLSSFSIFLHIYNGL